MLPSLLLLAMLNLTQVPGPASGLVGEPDGSRTVGVVPPFKAQPDPPGWLRATSHALAAVDTRHYIYEVYAGPKDQWLVRYLMLPETGEAFREIEQAFLFGPDPQKKARELQVTEITFEAKSATWKQTPFALVDRRDLMKP